MYSNKSITPASNTKSRFITWLPVIFIMCTAVVARLHLTSAENHYLLAGGDGPYFALQVRSLVENFRLAIPDMPLLFIITAFVAKILQLLQVAPAEECILIAIRFIDSFLPPLAAIPVFLSARELRKPPIKSGFLNFIMVAFSVLNFTTVIIFSYQLQKNALAIVWIFFFLYYLLRIIKYAASKDFYCGLLMLILCAFTHFGSFAILVFISGLTGLSWIMYNRKVLRSVSYKKIMMIAIGMLSIVLLIALLDKERFMRLLYIPLKIFEAPVLLFTLEGHDVLLNGRTLFFLILSNIMAFIAMIILIFNRKKIDKHFMIIGTTLVVCTFFFSSPLLGLEWANRLFMITYVPITVLYLIIFNSVRSKWVKALPAFIFIGLISYTLLGAVKTNPVHSITGAAYTEFKEIGKKVNFNNAAIIGRQDLRLLGSWDFRTKGIADYLYISDDYIKYDSSVYIIRQKNGSNFGKRYTEPVIPANVATVYQGQFFELFKLTSAESWNVVGKSYKGSRGKITDVGGNFIVVKDDNSGVTRKVFIDKNTKLQLQSSDKIEKGMLVEIRGEWKPFSLAIDAEQIREPEKTN